MIIERGKAFVSSAVIFLAGMATGMFLNNVMKWGVMLIVIAIVVAVGYWFGRRFLNRSAT